MRTACRGCTIVFVLLMLAGVPPALGQSSTATGSITVYFSPQDRPGDAVVRAFTSARREILVAIYEFTETQIADALVAASQRHVDVWLLMDQSVSHDRGSQSYGMAQIFGSHARIRAGIGGASGILHDKFAVVDEARVLTGSFNWTYSAEDRNWENLVIIDSASVAQAYAREFHHIWDAP